MDATELSARARRFHRAFEPIAGLVYFAEEMYPPFEALGFDPPVREDGCLPMPDLAAYYCSRAGCMGQVPGEVVVAAFGVFNPVLMIPEVERGWATASRDEILAARLEGATTALERVLGLPDELPRATELLWRAAEAGDPSGRFLYAGLRSLGRPGTPWGDLWRAADMVREHRGDSHIAAWAAAGLSGIEISVLTEVWAGMPSMRYNLSRGWTVADLEAAAGRLAAHGLLTPDGAALTDEGRSLREDIETSTDRQQRGIVEALGDDYDELVGILEPWAGALVGAGSYVSRLEEIPVAWGRLPA